MAYMQVTTLAARIPQADMGFLDFLHYLLRIDPNDRPTAEEALRHPWMHRQYPPILQADK